MFYGPKGREGSVAYADAILSDILCSDLTIHTAAGFSSSGKTAIGMVFRKADGKLSAFATNIYASGGYKAWGTDVDIPAMPNYAGGGWDGDLDGSSMTDEIIAYIGSNTNYAAGFCRAYSTQGTNVGSWYCPAYGELKIIFDNLNTINTSLSAIGSSTIHAHPSYGSIYIWASTEGVYQTYDIPAWGGIGMYLDSSWFYGEFMGRKTMALENMYALPVISIDY